MIVVDTNVIADLYLPGTYSNRAEGLLAADPEWAARVLWRSEFRNVLAGYLRRGALSFEQAVALQNEAEGLLQGREHDVESQGVLTHVLNGDRSAYDCEFVSLAVKLGVKLVTTDAKLLRAYPELTRALGAQAASADAAWAARHLLHLPRPGRRASGLPSPVLKLAWQRRHTYIFELDIIGLTPGSPDGRAATYSA